MACLRRYPDDAAGRLLRFRRSVDAAARLHAAARDDGFLPYIGLDGGIRIDDGIYDDDANANDVSDDYGCDDYGCDDYGCDNDCGNNRGGDNNDDDYRGDDDHGIDNVRRGRVPSAGDVPAGRPGRSDAADGHDARAGRDEGGSDGIF